MNGQPFPWEKKSIYTKMYPNEGPTTKEGIEAHGGSGQQKLDQPKMAQGQYKAAAGT
jgi:hypothetical protein